MCVCYCITCGINQLKRPISYIFQVKERDTLKTLLRHHFAVLAIATLGTISTLSPAITATFGQQEVDQNKFIAIAVPRGDGSAHQLLILEQIALRKPCWKESSTSSITLKLLLLNFDFTGICGRSTDSNGYSIRMAGQDLGLQYSLSIVKRDGDLVLIGTSNTARNAPAIAIGRTHSISSSFSKIILEPGWRFTKRTFNSKTLGHVYLTSDLAPPATANPTASFVR